jgi:branched-chain amino acid transport system ATP-binding protein
MELLELHALTKAFGQNTAVMSLDLQLREGQIMGLIGPNGSGKTTVFNLISGFLTPTRGRIYYQGLDITGLPPHKIARLGLARTFQLTAVFLEISVLENVILCCHLHSGTNLWQQFLRDRKTRRKEKSAEVKAMGLLEWMGLKELALDRAGDLPQGHVAGLGIANALATEPKLILLDEPVGGMNPTETEETMERIRRVKDNGISVFLVEHDMRAVISTCDEVTCINFGNKIAEGSPRSVCDHPEVIEAYLGGEVEECYL